MGKRDTIQRKAKRTKPLHVFLLEYRMKVVGSSFSTVCHEFFIILIVIIYIISVGAFGCVIIIPRNIDEGLTMNDFLAKNSTSEI